METREHHPANDANKGFSISLGSAWIILADLMANYFFIYFILVSNYNGNHYIFTPLNSEIICGQNVGTKVVCGMIPFFIKKAMLKIWKKSWVPFRSYLQNSTANPAHLHSNWAGLAVLKLSHKPLLCSHSGHILFLS